MIEATRAQKKRWFEQRSLETIRPRRQRAVGTALRRHRAAPNARDAATPRRKNTVIRRSNHRFFWARVASIMARKQPEDPQMPADAAEVTERWPNYQEGDFVITDYVFRTGEALPELKLHYRTLGTARRNTAGKIINGDCSCRATLAPARIGCARASPTSCLRPGSRSMRRNTSSSFRMRLDAVALASPPTGSRENFPITATTTWSNLVIG